MRCIFVGTGGFLGRIDGETRCAFWADEPVDHGFDPELLITVDLARTPSAAAAHEISWDEVEVDDCFTGPNGNVNGTTLGPVGRNSGSKGWSISSTDSERCFPLRFVRRARRRG